MKKLILFVLFTLPFICFAQKKINFSVFAGSNFTVSQKKENEFNTLQHSVISRVGDTFNLSKGFFHYNLNSTYTGKYGFLIGVKANFIISDHIGFSGGIGISQLRIKRNNSLSYTLTRTEQLRVVYTPPPGAVFFSIPGLETTGYEKFPNYYYYVYEENISMTSLQIPIEIVYRFIKKSKFDLKLGLIPTILLDYKLTPNEVPRTETLGGPYRPQNLPSTERKFNLTASAGIGFPIYKYLSGNINYTRYFSSITEGEVIPAVTPNVYSVSLVYQLPNFKIK